MSTTVKELKNRFADAVSTVEEINATLKKGLEGKPAAAQVAFMVAFGATKQAKEMLDEGKGAMDLFSQAAPTPSEPNPPIQVPEQVSQAAAAQLGMLPEAVAPFMFQISDVMLDAIDGLLKVAKEKILEASQVQA